MCVQAGLPNVTLAIYDCVRGITFGTITPCVFMLFSTSPLTHFQVTPSESVKQRYRHSITASRLEPGLTKVLIFGGNLKWLGVPVTETTTIEFGMLYHKVGLKKKTRVKIRIVQFRSKWTHWCRKVFWGKRTDC